MKCGTTWTRILTTSRAGRYHAPLGLDPRSPAAHRDAGPGPIGLGYDAHDGRAQGGAAGGARAEPHPPAAGGPPPARATALRGPSPAQPRAVRARALGDPGRLPGRER